MRLRLDSSAVPPLLTAVLVLVAWQLVSGIGAIPSYIIPSPVGILGVSITDWALAARHTYVTGLEATTGLVIGSIAAFLLAAAFWRWRRFSQAFMPFVVGANAVPVVAIAPILVLALGNGLSSKIAVVAFLCFFPLCVNAYKGFELAEDQYGEIFQLYRASRWATFRKALVPGAMPMLFAGARVNATYAVIGAVVAEFIGADSGLGFAMLQASRSLAASRLWLYLIIAVTMGILLYRAIELIERWYLRSIRSMS